MAKIISASIDLSKINKSKIILGKNGAKYYNIDIIVGDEKNKYDQDTSISEQQTKAQREAKEKKNYLGNGKTVWEGTKQRSRLDNSQASSEAREVLPPDDDLPF